jgi:hypothetical protein
MARQTSLTDRVLIAAKILSSLWPVKPTKKAPVLYNGRRCDSFTALVYMRAVSPTRCTVPNSEKYPMA